MKTSFLTTVVSSRIRLARNVSSLPFPSLLLGRVEESRRLAEEIYDSLAPLKENLTLYPLQEIDLATRELFQENYLISPTLLSHGAISSLITNPEGSIAVMINEEDHIREQYMGRGFCVKKLFERAMDIDENYIGKHVSYALNPRFGFLTACPTNLGTGLRASVMMFLPALSRKESLFSSVRRELQKEGFIIRGVNGEGSKGEGYLYQISNEITLGVREKDLVEELIDFVSRISEQEMAERLIWKEENVYALKDSCGRAYGILSNAEVLPYAEFVSLAAELKLGVTLGFYEIEDFTLLNDLIVAMRPHNLEMWTRDREDNSLFSDEEDFDFSADTVEDKNIYRAQCVRQFVERYVSKER